MKSENPTHHAARHHAKPLVLHVSLLAALTLVSCSTEPQARQGSTPVTLQPAHWYKARSNPPTYFPKGVPADHPTDFDEGSWVMTGDAVGTRYFIPVRGVDSRALTAEALTTMTPERRKELLRGGSSGVNLAEGIGKTANGIGYLLLGLDERASAARNRKDYKGPTKGMASAFEQTERR